MIKQNLPIICNTPVRTALIYVSNSRLFSNNFIIKFYLFVILCLVLPSPNVGLTIQMSVDQMSVGGAQTMSQNTKQKQSRSPWICGHQNVKATARDNIGYNTKDTYPVPGYWLKSLTPPRFETGPPGRKAGILPTTPQWRTYTKI